MTNDFVDLPFVESIGGKAVSLWSIQASGDWAADNATGRGYASAMVDYMRGSDDVGLLGMVAKAIGGAGQQDGVSVGFWTGISEGVAL